MNLRADSAMKPTMTHILTERDLQVTRLNTGRDTYYVATTDAAPSLEVMVKLQEYIPAEAKLTDVVQSSGIWTFEFTQ